MHQQAMMVVDEDHDLRKLWQVWLESLGYRGECFGSAEAVLADGVVAANVSAVITDFRLPGLDGIELIRRLRLQNPHLPVLMLTAVKEPGVVAALAEDPHAALLFKPAPLAKIELELMRLLDSSK